MYKDNRMKYKIASDKGKLIECRTCTTKRFIKENGRVVRYDFSTNKFEIVQFKVNIKNIIKQFI